MINTGKLAGRTIFVTGASRGIGKAIALKAAQDGANVVIAAKTATAHPKLPGTIYTAAEEIEKAGGKCLPCVVDVRDENQVRSAVEEAVKKFGGIDILINNASAISLTPTDQTDMKRYDLMHHINTRGTFLATKECLPYLKKSNHAHVLNISPPLNMESKWFANHVAYTMAKYGMSLCVLGHHEEFKQHKIGVNALWPRTAIQTAAMEMLSGGGASSAYRKPEIMADAAYVVLSQDPAKCTGNFYIDERVLFDAGVKDFHAYACDPSSKDNLMLDFFLTEEQAKPCVGSGAGETSMEQGLAQGPFGGSKKPAGASGPVENVEGIFRVIEASLTEELVSSTKAVYAFNVTGKEEGKWFIDMKNGAGKCGKGEPPSAADATLTMDGKNFFAMFTGKTKPATAYMLGKLKISGNLQKAMKLEKLMGKLKAKMKLNGLTIFITGASRGIGKAIAIKAAKDGANIVIAAKTADPHPKLEGTIYTAAAEIEAAGGKSLPCIVDVRNEEHVRAAVEKAVETFGGIDILINNASAISLSSTEDTSMKKYDLMHSVNVRGTFLVTKVCLPYLKKSKHGHVLMLSPPLNMSPHWFKPFVAYTISKYGMSMCVLGMHEEFREFGIAVNALWPRTIIHTAASDMLTGGEGSKHARKPDIMADAAYIILLQDPKTCTGNFFIDQELLMQYGIREFDDYACDVETKDDLHIDVFVDVDENPSMVFAKL